MISWSRSSWDVHHPQFLPLTTSLTVPHPADLTRLPSVILISSTMSVFRDSNWVLSAQKKWVTVKFNTQSLSCIFLISCLAILAVIQALIAWTEVDFSDYQLLSLIEFDLAWPVDLWGFLKESFSQQSFSRWPILSQWLHFFIEKMFPPPEFLAWLSLWLICCFLFDCPDWPDWLSNCSSPNFHLFLLARLADDRMIIAADAGDLTVWSIWLLIRLLIFSESISVCFMILTCSLRW